MPFSVAERALLLQAKGVGPRVTDRLELLGADSIAKLARLDCAAWRREAPANQDAPEPARPAKKVGWMMGWAIRRV